MTEDLFGSSEAASEGGKARARKLTSEQRREIATRAAESRWAKAGKDPLLEAMHEGTLKIGGLEIDCAVLGDKRRVITQSAFMRALGRARQAKGRQYYKGDVNLPAFLTAQNLKPFIHKDLEVTSSQVEFRTKSGVRAFGYPAELLPKVCDVFLDADAAEALTKSQKHIAKQAQILIRGLAHVGIIALVDEATGYDKVRDSNELARILEAFVAKEIQKWIRTFDLDFYEMICKLRGEPLERVKKRPRYFGRITNDLVYRRLAPGVLQELEKMNPADERGVRRFKHFQGLTAEFGHPKLKEHLSGVTTAMKFAHVQGMKWREFRKALDKTMPKWKPMPLFEQKQITASSSAPLPPSESGPRS